MPKEETNNCSNSFKRNRKKKLSSRVCFDLYLSSLARLVAVYWIKIKVFCGFQLKNGLGLGEVRVGVG